MLAPEVQLLFKSRSLRQKDTADLHAVVGSLDVVQADWLRRALTTVDPGHAWLAALQSPASRPRAGR